MKILKLFIRSESGATAIEYGLIAALIGVAIIVGITNTGDATTEMYQYIETSIINSNTNN